MKTIYFVRHGSTDFNETKTFQNYTTPLSAKGRMQAEFVAKRFLSIPVDLLISSPMTRAKETAEVIAEGIRCEVQESDLFHEILRPSVVHGKLKTDPDTVNVFTLISKEFTNPDYRHSDEENVFVVKARAERAVDFLESLKEERVLVVTHGTFLQIIMAVMMWGKDCPPEAVAKATKFFYPGNTGITTCLLWEGKWWLRNWNDEAHLGTMSE